MTKFTAATALVLTLTTAPLAQAALTGKWQGETASGSAIELELAAKGSELTGTFTRSGESSPLIEGKVLKNTFTFKALVNKQTEGFSGELEKDQITIWLDKQGPSKAIVLTRVKSK